MPWKRCCSFWCGILSMAEYKDDSGSLTFLYKTALGRLILKGLTAPGLSRLAGRYMDSGLSKHLIPGFAKKNGIDLTICQKTEFSSFNDFFTRKLKPDTRSVDMTPEALTAPCDGRLSAYPITETGEIPIKASRYTVKRLLGNDPAADRFAGGLCLVFRLCVGDYHRYHYFDSGVKGENHFIPGRLHTVRPIAMESVPVFHENSREYTLMETAHFGLAAQIEVGALLVGKIKNHQQTGSFERGQEKGLFLYGGSTVVLLLEAERAELLPEFPVDGQERQVHWGQRIGTAIK